MHYLNPVLFLAGLFLFSSRDSGVLAQTSTASWLFPITDGLIINYIDTVVLQWTSNYATPFMQMWCQNGTAGNNVVQGSNFNVPASGNYSYVLTGDDPSQTSFPVACHAQLATAKNGAGLNDPVGVTFVSITAVDAETFSLSTPASTSSVSTSSSSSSPSSSSSSSSATSSPSSSLPSNTSPASPTVTGNPPPPPPAGISSGAKAGIGIGVTVGVIGILGAVVWLFWRRRKDVGTSGELGIPELGNRRLRHEMAAPHGHQELGVERIRHEMAAPHGQQELEVKRHPPRIYEMAAQP